MLVVVAELLAGAAEDRRSHGGRGHLRCRASHRREAALGLAVRDALAHQVELVVQFVTRALGRAQVAVAVQGRRVRQAGFVVHARGHPCDGLELVHAGRG